MNKKVFFGAAFFMLGSSIVFGQEEQMDEKVNKLDEVVISDSKFKLKREQSGKVITKITAKELERSQGLSVAEVLTRTAGLFINGNGSAAGQNLGVYIRGGRNRQVVIRVDGITVSDPSLIDGDFDLRLLSVNQIQEIEILKGASSTLYGSGAATAVINIKTKSASKDRIAANFQSSIGTNQSQEDQDYDLNEFVNLASVNGTLGKVSYLASLGNQFSDGLSAGEATENGNADTYSKFNVTAKVGYQWNKNVKLQFFGNLDQFKNEFDQFDGSDADNDSFSRQLRGGVSAEYKYTNGSVNFTNSYSLFEREFLSSTFASKNESRFYTYDIYNKYNFSDKIYTVIGVNGSNSDFNGFSASARGQAFTRTIDDNSADFDIVDPYINMVYTSEFGLNLNFGGRLNIHSEYGTHLVYSLNPSYTLKLDDNYIKGLASYSTAYITPTLFQLFSPGFGNSDLNPEESTTIEGGVEISHQKKAIMSVVYFNRTSENFITSDPSTFVSINSEDDIKVDGIEVGISTLFLEDKLSVKANYTYTNIDKLDNNIRIPEHMVNANVGYQLDDKTYTSLSYQYNTDRFETDFSTFTPVTLDSYGVLDFYISHQLMKRLKVYAAINNITNEDYQEIFGFNTKGRNVRAGFSLEF